MGPQGNCKACWDRLAAENGHFQKCPAKRSQHALPLPYGPIPLLVFLPANRGLNLRTIMEVAL